ncbi:unnamed protein product [Mytilus coruscus]|uniref:Uncharacterized protein n=1 Tax=Mytilus coruscus TaxID=42192 RepID=A0A6J8EIK5_MYTCO|nr:unnamed protein product [Mytilus coruscus]
MQKEEDSEYITTVNEPSKKSSDAYQYKERQKNNPKSKDSASYQERPCVNVQQPPNHSEAATSSKSFSTDTLNAKVTLVKSKSTEQMIDKKPEKKKSKYEFRLCRTNENLDNRTFYHKKKIFFQGELIYPNINNQIESETKPNIDPAGVNGSSLVVQGNTKRLLEHLFVMRKAKRPWHN